MATTSITIVDAGNGVDVSVTSDPPFPGPAAEDQTMTNAQKLILIGMQAIGEVCNANSDEG